METWARPPIDTPAYVHAACIMHGMRSCCMRAPAAMHASAMHARRTHCMLRCAMRSRSYRRAPAAAAARGRGAGGAAAGMQLNAHGANGG
jgi:hypothetical protein